MADNEEGGLPPALAIAGTMPATDDNGFYGILGDLHTGAESGKRVVTVTVWDVSKTSINRRKGGLRTEILSVVSVEPLSGADAEQAMAMHDRMHGERTGVVTLGAALGEPDPAGTPE
jgi:hypothetical protein